MGREWQGGGEEERRENRGMVKEGTRHRREGLGGRRGHKVHVLK